MIADEVAPEPAPRPAAIFNKTEFNRDRGRARTCGVVGADRQRFGGRLRSRCPTIWRRSGASFARKIVERHRTYAAVGGLVPLPVVNIAGVTAINVRMVQQLSELYQVPFQRDRTRALIVSLIGGAAPAGFGTATSSTLMWIVPGGLLVGLGVSALAAGALTRAIGQVFVEGFENGANAGG